jgi:NAD-dependent SIR2 family protein deacetylase
MIQAQYDAALKDPPWEHENTFNIDDRPKKKRKLWYYEVVAPDGKVVDIIDPETAEPEQEPRRSSRSRSSNTTTSNSRMSTPTANSSDESSLSSCPSLPSSVFEDAHDELPTERPSIERDLQADDSDIFARPETPDLNAAPNRRSNRKSQNTSDPTSATTTRPPSRQATPDLEASPREIESGSHPKTELATATTGTSTPSFSAFAGRLSRSNSNRQLQNADNPATFKSEPNSTTATRPPSRANSLKRPSTANSLPFAATSSANHSEPLTRTQVLRREESTVLKSEDEEPTTQSSQSSSRSLPNLKGRDLFDSMIWKDPFTTSIFYMFITSLRQKIQDVRDTTETHKFLRVLRDGGRLVRNYTQNIDLLEEREGLVTDISLGPGNRSRFHSKSTREPRPGNVERDHPQFGGVEVVALHGSLATLRCQLCSKPSSWDDPDNLAATLAGTAPECDYCTEYNQHRKGRGRRSLAVGRLRPDIVLYGEEHPAANLISPLVTHDLKLGPDVLLIMGTSLKVHGLKILVREFAKAVHDRGGKVVFVNRTKPPESTWGDVIDYWVAWNCDTWVSDLKKRRADIWLPQGTMMEDNNRRESSDGKRRASGTTKQPTKRQRPQALRDDKTNGVFVTFKILDMLGKFRDSKGRTADRVPYWPQTISRVSNASIQYDSAKKSHKKGASKAPARKSISNATPTTRSKPNNKRKSLPDPLSEDYVPTSELDVKNNETYLVAKLWGDLRKIAPGLTPHPPRELRYPFSEMTSNTPNYLTSFPSSSPSNHLPNVGGKTNWGPMDQMNLMTLPPSGASIPVHTPKTTERKAVSHGYGTRLSGRFASDIDDPKVVHSVEVEGKGKEKEVRVSLGSSEASDCIVVEDEGGEVAEGEREVAEEENAGPMTPNTRIKRNCSIGNIVSSPEEWHDASEILTNS